MIPTLETERLILRGKRSGDSEPMIRAYAEDDFARFITRKGSALDRTEAWAAMAIVAGSWAVSGYGQWIVEERTTSEPVGRIRL